MKRPKKLPKQGWMVYVEMDDIEHDSKGWEAFDDLVKVRPRMFKAVGWVIRASKRTLVIASLTSPDQAFCHYILPWGSITRCDRLT
jgi:hypothetical protein